MSIGSFLLRRLGSGLIAIFGVCVLVFLFLHLVPGDPVDHLAGGEVTLEQRHKIEVCMGLDKPMATQFVTFLGHIADGTLGHQCPDPGRKPTVAARIFEVMPYTIELAFAAMVMAIVVGIPLGLVAGLKPDSLVGRGIMAGSILGFSLPTFWVGLVLIMVFSVHLGWLPSNGRGQTVLVAGVPVSLLTADGLAHLAMPALNLALFKLSLLVRLTRAGTREAVLQDYVKFARAKGLPQSRVIGVHVLKNILIPIVTVIGLELGSVIAFAIVTESIFAWPGTGKLLIDSINQLDRPVIVAYLLVIVTLFVAINFMVDVLYSTLDPRVRLGGAGAH